MGRKICWGEVCKNDETIHIRTLVLIGLILVIAAGMTGFPSFPLFADIFVFLAAGANLLVLFPGLVARVERSQRGARRRKPANP